MSDFPLHQWFNIGERIPKSDRLEAEAQVRLYAFKDGAPPSELNESLRSLRLAVKQHNGGFENED